MYYDEVAVQVYVMHGCRIVSLSLQMMGRHGY